MQNFFKSKLFKIIFVCIAFLFGIMSFEITTKKSIFLEKILTTVAKPVTGTVVEIHNGILNFFNSFFRSGKFKEENELLKKEIAKTRKQIVEYNALKNENEQLKQALKIQNSNKNFKIEVGSFVARNPSDFYGFTINIGKNKGISEGDVVLTKNGLVGTISKVFGTYSNVTTILGIDMKIPAIDTSKDEKGILGGSSEFSKDGLCVIRHLNKSTKCKAGDVVSTYGHSNYPENLPIGKIKEIRYGKNGMSCIAIVEPFENVTCVKDVVVIKKIK